MRTFCAISFFDLVLTSLLVMLADLQHWKEVLSKGCEVIVSLVGLLQFAQMHNNLTYATMNLSIAFIRCLLIPITDSESS